MLYLILYDDLILSLLILGRLLQFNRFAQLLLLLLSKSFLLGDILSPLNLSLSHLVDEFFDSPGGKFMRRIPDVVIVKRHFFILKLCFCVGHIHHLFELETILDSELPNFDEFENIFAIVTLILESVKHFLEIIIIRFQELFLLHHIHLPILRIHDILCLIDCIKAIPCACNDGFFLSFLSCAPSSLMTH